MVTSWRMKKLLKDQGHSLKNLNAKNIQNSKKAWEMYSMLLKFRSCVFSGFFFRTLFNQYLRVKVFLEKYSDDIYLYMTLWKYREKFTCAINFQLQGNLTNLRRFFFLLLSCFLNCFFKWRIPNALQQVPATVRIPKRNPNL